MCGHWYRDKPRSSSAEQVIKSHLHKREKQQNRLRWMILCWCNWQINNILCSPFSSDKMPSRADSPWVQMWLHISNVDVIGWKPLAYIVTCGGDSIPTEGTLLGIQAERGHLWHKLLLGQCSCRQGLISWNVCSKRRHSETSGWGSIKEGQLQCLNVMSNLKLHTIMSAPSNM